MTIRHVPVLIVGAGFAGLTAAMLLAWRGAPCLVVERHATTSRHPKAHGVNRRSLELLRVIPGLEDELHQASRARPNDSTIIIAEQVTGREIKTLLTPSNLDMPDLSPAMICSAGQDRVEPILLRHASALGAEIRFSTELAGFTQAPDGVHATLRDLASGEETHIFADYLVAADGGASPVRRALGVEMQGHRALSHAVSILFKADLAAPMRNRGFVLYYLQNPKFTGAFVSCDAPDQGQINVEYDPSRESASDFDATRCVGVVREALGMPDLDVNVLDVMAWEMSALLAERMSVGRVFLAGDAAHVMPPVGGLGGQTAIQDAADLAWKLAMVLQGHASPALLDTYEAERLPVARLTIARQIANYVERLRPDRAALRDPAAGTDYLSVAMGYRYRSGGIQAQTPDDGRPAEDPFHPTGRPGARIAHAPLQRAGRLISTHDLTGRGFVLLAGPDGAAWVAAARNVAERSGAPLAASRVGEDLIDATKTFLARTGLGPDGALLMRPDGFIAWRSQRAHADPATILEDALARALCRDALARERAA